LRPFRLVLALALGLGLLISEGSVSEPQRWLVSRF
jgi:hypothetical protein